MNILSILVSYTAGFFISTMMVMFAFITGGWWFAIPVIFLAAEVGTFVASGMMIMYATRSAINKHNAWGY